MTTPTVIASPPVRHCEQSAAIHPRPAPASQPIPAWLTLLAQLHPPKATLLIGAGAGTSPWVKHLQTANHPNVTLIEADEAKVIRLKTATQNQPHWQVKHYVIAQHTAPTQFYTASLQTENGLLEPESLRSLWPNLKTTHQRTRQAISLAELQADAETPANWLLVDCLPALPIIQGTRQGAAQPLAAFDVIAARVLLQDTAPHSSTATVDLLQLALQAQGFMCVAIETSRHPAIGHALFVRDTAAQAAQKAAEAAADQLAAERQKHKELLKQAAEQAATKLETELNTQRDGFTTEKASLISARDAEAKLKTDALASFESEKKAHAQEKIEFLKALQDRLAHESSWLAHSCLVSDDMHQSAQKIIVTHKLTDKKLFDFLVELSDQLAKSGDKPTALSYLIQGRKSLTAPSVEELTVIVKRLLSLGQANEAQAVYVQAALDCKGVLQLTDQERASIKKASQSLHQQVVQKNAHGHDLLLSALSKHLTHIAAQIPGRKPVLIEIGTTREDVPGQGSTKLLADYCKANGLDFITVDMDPQNSEMAKQTFTAISVTDFQAITSKGEDYLRHYEGAIDFIFLDAYDFDHGQHSELRQSRYEKFLGSRIDESQCHRMHLDCAQSVAKKLSPFGLVCFDDTWLEDGKWTAKGTLGMPFLLANGFELVEARNRAALLRRTSSFTGVWSA